MSLIKKLSDRVEIRRVALLGSFRIDEEKTGYQAKASSEEELRFWRNFENELGEMAAKAGYPSGGVFEYVLTIKKK